ncbi:phenol 2-monooxygenase [Enemella evansiae]|uniref:phenol 2-monooxygenase n=1 Tax=Enemella evansiae TaxID=2016499 RepID=UPI000B96895C|nr:phenol 2-monooxygenase [Enemella evansiae]OYO12468.1 phenol 2-monooxygenase [Enemella evansiae]
MQYELKTQVITPQRQTFDHVAKRFGDKPATRYQEGSYYLQPVENFHYRPTWAPDKELYDADFSRFKLVDPHDYADPRQYYYTPYVTNRSQMHEAFARSLDYVGDHDLLDRMPQPWRDLIAQVVVPLRHLESGAQMIFSGACRFSYGTTIAQCLGYEGFDRIGNAQLISRVGLALGDGTATVLKSAKQAWVEDDSLQGLRRMVEILLVEQDWAVAVIGMDVLDMLLDALIYRHLDEEAIIGGAGAYSLLAQHIASWYPDHRKWLDALYKTWLADPEHGDANRAALSEAVSTWLPQAVDAVRALAEHADTLVDVGCAGAVTVAAEKAAEHFRALGVDVDGPGA